jgi:hypothetical protein
MQLHAAVAKHVNAVGEFQHAIGRLLVDQQGEPVATPQIDQDLVDLIDNARRQSQRGLIDQDQARPGQ